MQPHAAAAVMRSRKLLSARLNWPASPVSCGSSPSLHLPSIRTPITHVLVVDCSFLCRMWMQSCRLAASPRRRVANGRDVVAVALGLAALEHGGARHQHIGAG